MESLDVKDLVIYAEVRGRPGILFRCVGGFFDDWTCEKVNLLRIEAFSVESHLFHIFYE
jgi:hypothetical protein